MAKKICCHCGIEYDDDFARSNIDSDFKSGSYDRICNYFGDLCFGCAGAELTLEEDKEKKRHRIHKENA